MEGYNGTIFAYGQVKNNITYDDVILCVCSSPIVECVRGVLLKARNTDVLINTTTPNTSTAVFWFVIGRVPLIMLRDKIRMKYNFFTCR